MKIGWLGGAAPAAILLGFGVLGAQERPTLQVSGEIGPLEIDIVTDRGYAAVAAQDLEALGWTVRREGSVFVLAGGEGVRIELRPGTPFFRWSSEDLQLSDPPYVEGDALYIPVQLLSDFLPSRFPDRYTLDGPSMTLRVGETLRGGESPRAAEPPPFAPADDGTRVVIIDPGHGGNDPGAIGPGSVREKTVALGIGRALAEALRDQPGLEVHLLRDEDSFIDLWDRGARATELKGDRHGVFLSIHANSFPARRTARGFETLFLSEARTDDERRVAAIENAPLRVQSGPVGPEDDLGFILRELRNLDHQHWSSLLGELVQEELERVHPGPNRGVKQGPLAVLTNALMPAVLIEMGFLSHAEEGLLLGQESFQRDAAGAIATAVLRFFGRYPPGGGSGEER